MGGLAFLRRWRGLLDGLLLFVLALLAFSPALGAGWIWDDDDYVTENPVLARDDGLSDIWLRVFPPAVPPPQYYPLVHTSFWVEYRLWGTSEDAGGRVRPRSFGFHLDNILLHGLAALLAWRFLRRLRVPGAWLAAALFAVHPVQAETVAWVTERKNLLSMVCALGAALAWCRWSGLGAQDAGERRPRPARRSVGWLVACLFLFAGALLSKTVTASLPAVLLLLHWWREGRLRARVVVPLGLMLAAGAAMGLLVTAQLEQEFVGASRIWWDQTPAERWLVAGRALWFYAVKLLWPARLVFFYPRWEPDASNPLEHVWPVAAVLLLVLAWLARRRVGRGPIVGLLVFGGVLLPAIGVVAVYPHRFSWVADHFQYHASLALLALLAAALVLGSRRLLPPAWGGGRSGARCQEGPVGSPPPRTPWFAAGLILACLAGRSWARSWAYEDLETLWETTLADNPDAYAAHVNLAALRMAERARSHNPERRRRLADEAAAHYREALRVDPSNLAAHTGLGQILIDRKQYGEAEAHLRQAFALHPDTLEANLGLALLLGRQGRFAEALPFARSAAAMRPEELPARMTLGDTLAALGDWAEAAREYQAAEGLSPGLPAAGLGLGRAWLRSGRTAAGVEVLEGLLSRNPRLPPALEDLAWVRSSHASARWRSPAAAADLVARLCRLQSCEDARALDLRAAVEAARGRFETAAELAGRALEAARQGGNVDLVEGVSRRLELYLQGRPFQSATGLP